MAKNARGHDIKKKRTDGGLEYLNLEVKAVLEPRGICHQRTVAYTQQQNGSAKRNNRTIAEASQTMIHAKNLNPKLWAEAVNTAVYLLNLSGTKTVQKKTPYEL